MKRYYGPNFQERPTRRRQAYVAPTMFTVPAWASEVLYAWGSISERDYDEDGFYYGHNDDDWHKGSEVM